MRPSGQHDRAASERHGFLDPCDAFGIEPGCTIAGVDEVGRGALAGPVTAAAVVLDPSVEIPGLADSKAMTPRRRESVAALIRERAAAYAVAHVEPGLIDALGIAEATRRAMVDSLAQLSTTPSLVLVDGLPVRLHIESRAIVRGDSMLAAIAAASVIAKVERDAIMVELDSAYPGYGFAAHKGYGTREHLAALKRLGPCEVHRRSFSPCSQTSLF